MPSPNDQPRFKLPPFAEQLVRSGYITVPQLQQALLEKRKTDRSLMEILPTIAGRPLPPELLSRYREEQLTRLKATYGVNCLDPETEALDWTNIEQLFKTYLPFEICRRYQILPLRRPDASSVAFCLAMVDPDNQEILDDLRRILRVRDLRFDRRAILLGDYQRLMEGYRARKEAGSSPSPAISEQHLETLVNVTDVLEEERAGGPLFSARAPAEIGSLEGQEPGPVVTLATEILVRAIESKASEIHLEPEEHRLAIRFRQDGVLRKGFAPLERDEGGAVLSQFKNLAQLESGSSPRPGRGRISKTFSGRKIDFHARVYPGRYGEKIVLRVFDSRSALWSLEELLPIESTRRSVSSLLERAAGVLLLSGPEGGGSTTTFYSLLADRNQSGKTLATVENPIERVLNGVEQVEIDPSKGSEYLSALKSVSSRGANPIGIDRLDGRAVASAALDLAATGHLVLAGLESDSAVGAIQRLVGSVGPRAVADNLIGVINQRLLRRVCPVCRLKQVPPPEKLARFGLSLSSATEAHLFKANSLQEGEIERNREKGRLCRYCNGNGYQGQIGVFETIGVSPLLKESIANGAPAPVLEGIARQEGSKPLLAYGMELVSRGDTTLEEIERVLGDLLPKTGAPPPVPVSLSPSLFKRLEKLESLVKEIAVELQDLKAEVSGLAPPTPPPSVGELSPELPPARVGRLDPRADQETVVSDAALYEELTDPGDWERLKQDLDPARDTIVNVNALDDDPATWEVNSSFRSVPDPW